MTTGQRIAQKRKEQNLSQEALGEQLGVSRQSVYKWESDNTLPEVDKLVAMSRLFGVNLGWLLGVEEQEKGVDELTESQLRLVEEIAGRYLAGQPPKRRQAAVRWVLGLAAVGILVAGVWTAVSLEERLDRMAEWQGEVSAQLEQLPELSHTLEEAEYRVSTTEKKVELLREQHYNLTTHFGVEVFRRDLQAWTVDFYAWAMPDADKENVVFLVETAEGEWEFPGVPGENRRYYAKLTAPLTDSITVSVYCPPGGREETQILERFTGLSARSAPYPGLYGTGDLRVSRKNEQEQAILPDDAVWCMVEPSSAEIGIKDVKVGLFKNRELVTWLALEDRPDGESNVVRGASRWNYCLPDTELALKEGDILHYVTFTTDELDREFVREWYGYAVKLIQWPGAEEIYVEDARYPDGCQMEPLRLPK